MVMTTTFVQTEPVEPLTFTDHDHQVNILFCIVQYKFQYIQH